MENLKKAAAVGAIIGTELGGLGLAIKAQNYLIQKGLEEYSSIPGTVWLFLPFIFLLANVINNSKKNK